MLQKILSLSFLMLLPVVLLAHGSHGNGIMAGFTHPIFGIDHAIAILGTGFLGYLIHPSKWYLPLLAFLIAMIIGGLLGINHEATFLIEKTIAFSVLCIGLIIAFSSHLSLIPVAVILSFFGFVHGYAHGAEMSETNTALKYISGYSLGTLLLGILGMLLSKGINSQVKKDNYREFFGGIICGCGIMMLVG